METLRRRYLDGFAAGAAWRARMEEPAAAADDPLIALRACSREDRPPNAIERPTFERLGLFYGGPAQDAFALRLNAPEGPLPGEWLAQLGALVGELGNGSVEIRPPDLVILPGLAVRAAATSVDRASALGLTPRTALDAGNLMTRVLCADLLALSRSTPVSGWTLEAIRQRVS